MRYRDLLLVAVVLFFMACGSGNGKNTISQPKEELEHNSTFKHSSKTVTIYVHGFKKDGYGKDAEYGTEYSSDFTKKLIDFTKHPTLETYNHDSYSNVITGVEYYGNKAPTYYTKKDIDDINKTLNGIPRYALIVAKYTKHILDKTGAKKVNIISVSMGSLITRYMIEKNLEKLSSDKKIEKWMSAEGVIRGNYALSKIDEIDSSSIKDIVNSFFQDSPETQQMKYDWIESNLTKNRDTMDSLYYKNILVGQITLTNSDKSDGVGLKYILPTHGGFQPNDGYQLVKDTYFKNIVNYIQVPSHTLIHTDHIGINENNSVFATITAFLEAKKRVRVTLIDATINKFHERITPTINESAEVVFANSIYSPKAMSRWSMGDAISQRVYNSGTLNIHHFKNKKKKKEFNQILFDDFVLRDESRIEIEMEGYEIDRSSKYDINEVSTGSKESMGKTRVSIELKNGTYSIVSNEWSGHIKIEVLEM